MPRPLQPSPPGPTPTRPATGSPTVHVDRAALEKPLVLTLGNANYELLARLGSGGMADVIHARRVGPAGFTRDVAIKRIRAHLRDDDMYQRRFLHEARIASHLHHPNIAQVYDLQQRGNTYLLVMEWIDGTSLRAVLDLARAKGIPFTPAFTCYVGAEIADALAHAHAATDTGGTRLGIVHRDVTPANVMLTRGGEVKLLDFGIAVSTLKDREITRAGQVFGKFSYMSPEQVLQVAPVDGRSDLYSLGLILVELLTLRRVFENPSSTQTLVAVAEADPRHIAAALAGLPQELAHLLRRVLSKYPDDRPPTGEALARELRYYVARRGTLYGAAEASAEALSLDGLPDLSHGAPAPVPHPDLTPAPWAASLDANGHLERGPQAPASALPPPLPRPHEPTLELASPPLPTAAQSPSQATASPTRPRRWRHRVLALALFGAAAAISAALLHPGFGSTPRKPLLVVESEPSGAAVVIGAQEVGTTPYLADNDYPEGIYGLHLQLAGFRTYDATFEGGRDATVRATLRHR